MRIPYAIRLWAARLSSVKFTRCCGGYCGGVCCPKEGPSHDRRRHIGTAMIRSTFTIEHRSIPTPIGPIRFKVGIHRLQILGLTIWKCEELIRT